MELLFKYFYDFLNSYIVMSTFIKVRMLDRYQVLFA